MRHSLLFLFFISLCIESFSQQGWESLLTKESYSNENYKIQYRLYKAPNVKQRIPLVIFLHGAGERGSNNESQLSTGISHFFTDSLLKKYSFALIAPQCPENERWVETDWTKPSHAMTRNPSAIMQCLFHLIDSILTSDQIDTNRIYITGLSMGGFGTWDAIQRRPHFFAAAAPICGGGDEKYAATLTEIPLKIFHGKLDHLVIPARSINMYNAIRSSGGTKAELILFSHLGHLCWEKVYSDPSFYSWLFQQRKNEND